MVLTARIRHASTAEYQGTMFGFEDGFDADEALFCELEEF